jgi:hypothetical protein
MRKFILVAALVLVSANAQAGISRGLTTVASSDAPAVAERAKAAEAAKLSARSRPSMRQQSSQRLQQQNALAAQHGRSPGVGMLLKAKGRSVLAHVKFALHRRGIYW